MANYSLVINSKFQPFSFERYMQPIMQYAQLYETQQAALDTLLEQSAQWERLANLEGNEKSYAKYKKFSDELKKQADELATVGLTPNSRGALHGLRSSYFTDIKPMEEIYQRAQKLADEQRVARVNDPTIRFDNDYTTGLRMDDWVRNPNMSYTPISGKEVTATTSALSAQLAKNMVSDPELKELLQGDYVRSRYMAGASLADIILAAADDPSAPEGLRQIKNTVRNYFKNNTAYNQEWADPYINAGLYSALGSVEQQIMPGKYGRAEQESIRLQEERLSLDREGQNAELAYKGLTKNADGTFTYNASEDHSKTKTNSSLSGTDSLIDLGNGLIADTKNNRVMTSTGVVIPDVPATYPEALAGVNTNGKSIEEVTRELKDTHNRRSKKEGKLTHAKADKLGALFSYRTTAGGDLIESKPGNYSGFAYNAWYSPHNSSNISESISRAAIDQNGNGYYYYKGKRKNLSTKQVEKIKKDLQDNGFTTSEVSIYIDPDTGNHDEIIVVPKGKTIKDKNGVWQGTYGVNDAITTIDID